MNDITIKRGRKTVTFKKLPNYFAVKLKSGKAFNEAALEAACGRPPSEISHVESVATDKMEIFAVKDHTELEQTTDRLRQAPASDIVTHVYSVDETPGGGVIPLGTMTLQFSPDIADNEKEKILAEFGLEVLKDLDYLPHGHTVRLTELSKYNPLKIAADLQGRKEVLTAEPDLGFQVSFKHVPQDTRYQDQWHLKNRGDLLGLMSDADVKAEEAWNYIQGTRDIIVCVMDDAFDLEHPDFAGPGKIVAAKDFGEEDFDPNPVLEDDNHGTACAGVAIAEQNGLGVVGLAPGCAFMPIRMSTWLSDESLEELFQYAIDNHADVISCSWSASAWDFPLSTKIHGIIHKAATQGRSNGKGCVILFAAGNEDRPLDDVVNGVTSHQGFALHPDVVSVGASNSLDQRSAYSNHGPELSLCAPSSGSPGRGITTTDRRGAKGYSSGDYTSSFGGTSSATPLAAGLAALILSVNPELTSAEVRTLMMETADKIDQENGQYENDHSPLYGHGRINAHRAVAAAAGDNPENRLPEVLLIEHRINKPIPDFDEVQDPIIFPLEVQINSIEVSVDIRHTWSSDLRVFLISPQGHEVILHNRAGGSQDNVIQTYRSSDDPELFEPIVGTNAKGDWRLRIMDLAEADVGTLLKWSVGITY